MSWRALPFGTKMQTVANTSLEECVAALLALVSPITQIANANMSLQLATPSGLWQCRPALLTDLGGREEFQLKNKLARIAKIVNCQLSIADCTLQACCCTLGLAGSATKRELLIASFARQSLRGHVRETACQIARPKLQEDAKTSGHAKAIAIMRWQLLGIRIASGKCDWQLLSAIAFDISPWVSDMSSPSCIHELVECCLAAILHGHHRFYTYTAALRQQVSECHLCSVTHYLSPASRTPRAAH